MRDIDSCRAFDEATSASSRSLHDKTTLVAGKNKTHPDLLVRQTGVCAYIQLTRSATTALAQEWQIKPLMGDQYDFRDIWHHLWGIRTVPIDAIAAMRQPLMTVKDVAQLAGTCERTIRRAGDARDSAWQLPRHVDLGPRTRRYLRPLVEAWALQIPPEPWLTPAPRRPILASGLTPKSTLSMPLSDTNGQPRS